MPMPICDGARRRRLSPGVSWVLAFLWIVGAVTSAGNSLAGDPTIDMFQAAFLPQSLSIQPGDTVRWVWQRGTHTIASGLPDGAPGTVDEPGAIFEGLVDEFHPTFSHTFSEFQADGFAFFCRQHPNQIGFVQISSGEFSFRVAVVDNVFNPQIVHVFEGDTVRWEHEPMEDDHTVTSGLSSEPSDLPGALFDALSSDALPVFAFQFLKAGEYPYFCRPHEHMGMKGRIHVQKKFVRGDASGEGFVNITDAISILNFLFLGEPARDCRDALDSNDDGVVNLGDPIFTLNFLFLGGVKMPAPYPLPGGDRTDDLLPCR